MAVPSKNFTVIIDTDIDTNSVITEALMTDLRDNDIHLEEWLGKNYVAAVDHDHDGTNSKAVVLALSGLSDVSTDEAAAFNGAASATGSNVFATIADTKIVPGVTGGKNLIILSEANLATPSNIVNPLSRFKMKPDCVMLMGLPGLKGGIIRGASATKLSRFDIAKYDIGEVDDVLFGSVALDSTGAINAEDRLEAICFRDSSGFIKSGIYTGSGGATQAITGIGFQPDLVIIWAESTQATERGVAIRSTNMIGSRIFHSGVHTTSIGIDSLDIDGFTVEAATSFNDSFSSFGYLAIKSGMNSNGERIDLNTYSGDSTATRDLALALGYTPQFAIILETTTNTNSPIFKTEGMGIQSLDWLTPSKVSTQIKEFSDGSVVVGNSDNVNASGRTYDIITFDGGIIH